MSPQSFFMEEILLMNTSPNPSEVLFLALISLPVILVLLAEFYYSKKTEETDRFLVKNDDKYDPTPIDEKEAVKVSKKLKENAVVLGVKKPKSFKTKRKPQTTKVLTSKSVKKPRNDYLSDLVDKQ